MNPFQSSPGPDVLAAQKPNTPEKVTLKAQSMPAIGMPEQVAYGSPLNVTPPTASGVQFTPNQETPPTPVGSAGIQTPTGSTQNQFVIPTDNITTDAFATGLTGQDVLKRRQQLEAQAQGLLADATKPTADFTAANERLQNAMVAIRGLTQSFLEGSVAPGGATLDYASGMYNRRAGFAQLEADRANAALAVQTAIRQGNIDAANAVIGRLEKQIERAERNEQGIADVLAIAAQYPDVPPEVLQKISAAPDKMAAIKLAGKYIQDPKAKYELEKAKLDLVLANKADARAEREMTLRELEYTRKGEELDLARQALQKQKQEEKYAKDLITKDKIQRLDQQDKDLEMIMNHPGFSASVGTTVFGRRGTNPAAEKAFRGYIIQAINQKTIDYLSEFRKEGGALGNMTEKEWPKFEGAATALNSWAIKDSNGNLTGYFDAPEEDVRKELTKMQEAVSRIRASAASSAFTPDESALIDEITSDPSTDLLNYY